MRFLSKCWVWCFLTRIVKRSTFLDFSQNLAETILLILEIFTIEYILQLRLRSWRFWTEHHEKHEKSKNSKLFMQLLVVWKGTGRFPQAAPNYFQPVLKTKSPYVEFWNFRFLWKSRVSFITVEDHGKMWPSQQIVTYLENGGYSFGQIFRIV